MGWVGEVGFPACITGHMTRVLHPEGSAFRAFCIQGGLHPGGRGFGQIPPQDTWDTVNKQAVRILLECILVSNRSMDVFNDWKE